MDYFYQQKLVNEKNELQRQVAKANRQIAQLSEQVMQYETLLASLDEGMIPSQIRLRGGPIDQAGVHERSFVARAHAQDRKLTAAEQLALVRHAQNDSKANQLIARSKPQPPKSKELGGISEATLVRGMAAVKLKSELSGKKLPTSRIRG